MAITNDDYLTIFDNLYSKINTNLTVEYNAGRINDNGYADVLAQSLVQLINSAIGIYVNADKVNSDVELNAGELELKLAQTKELERDTERKNELLEKQKQKLDAEINSIHIDASVKDEQWGIQQDIMGHQLSMIAVDALNKPNVVAKDLATKDGQINQLAADAAFTESKKTVMENTRLDNVRMQAAREYAEYLKYISAADVVPSPRHFDNLTNLITAITAKQDGTIVSRADIIQKFKDEPNWDWADDDNGGYGYYTVDTSNPQPSFLYSSGNFNYLGYVYEVVDAHAASHNGWRIGNTEAKPQ